ncbi:hypothetical protein KT71_08545 [Congregibacter litoralis KT71]|uniref:HD superfamily hydrolase n=1 Tax=Congregibacter litoralis KT71 TaxID=314285 RepID=A4AD38_9GAMM|nr:hypothetical protein KT71_08545 [Congregibacter litoralis KT71]
MNSRISKPLLGLLRSRFELDWHGIHGVRHWARVRRNGLLLAQSTGADVAVVEYFAFVHDVARVNDDYDPWHGERAAEFAFSLCPQTIDLKRSQLKKLTDACREHSEGYTEADITVMTCWDADRLDLGRVGIRPNPEYLCTSAAKDPGVLEAAYRRSLPDYHV